MPTSVISRRIDRPQGFTLLELLVVLAVAGLLASVALPGAGTLVSRAEWNANKDNILVRISSLGFEAYKTASSLELPSEKTLELLQLPSGWAVEQTEDPVQYYPNGFCTGGAIVLLHGSLAIELGLAPPLCKPEVKHVRTGS